MTSRRIPGPGEVEFVVGDQRFILAMKTRGLMALQKHFNKGDAIADVQDIFDRARSGSIEHVTAVFWAAFQKYHPEVTFDQALEFVDASGGLDAVAAQLHELNDSTQPDPADIKELAPENPPTAQAMRGPGERSRSRRSASV